MSVLYFLFYSKYIYLLGGTRNGKNVYEHDDDDVYGKDDV